MQNYNNIFIIQCKWDFVNENWDFELKFELNKIKKKNNQELISWYFDLIEKKNYLPTILIEKYIM